MKLKITIAFFVVFILFATTVMAATVTRNMPSRADPGSTIAVELTISNIQADAGMSIAVEDMLPKDFTVSSWEIEGSSQQKSDINARFIQNRAGWEFVPSGTSAKITYKVVLPTYQSIYIFGPVVWFDKSGISPNNALVNQVGVRYKVCGDNICDPDEGYSTCATDCPTTTSLASTTTVQSTSTTHKNVITPPKLERNPNTLFIVLIALLILILVIFFWHTRRKRRLRPYDYYKI
jgi:hypothetical protein